MRIKIQTVGGYGRETRTALWHANVSPAEGRTVETVAAGADRSFRVVRVDREESTVQDVGSADASTVRLLVDNTFDDPMSVRIAGSTVVAVELRPAFESVTRLPVAQAGRTGEALDRESKRVSEEIAKLLEEEEKKEREQPPGDEGEEGR